MLVREPDLLVRPSRLLLLRLTRALAPALAGGAVTIGCAYPTYSTRLGDGPDSVDLRMDTPFLRSGQQATLVIQSVSRVPLRSTPLRSLQKSGEP